MREIEGVLRPWTRPVWLMAFTAVLTAQPPQARFVEIPGAQLPYLDWGGTGEPLVLVPGGCGTAWVFDGFARRLTSRFHVLGLAERACGQPGIDQQIDRLIQFLDALRIQRATFAGHSSGAGQIVRLANRNPARASRLILFDPIYEGVPDEFEAKMEAAISAKLGPMGPLSFESNRARFEAWELGAWSDGAAREFREQTETGPGGGLRYRPRPKAWQSAFAEDAKAGRYFETSVRHPTLIFVAKDLDIERIRQFSPAQQRELRPMAEAIGKARRAQIERFRKNGSHVRVKWMARTSHYPFIDRERESVTAMIRFAHRNRLE